MRLLQILAGIGIIIFGLPKPAEAIIFLPALILIPIAKIIAVIIGGASLPVLGISTAWSKVNKKPVLKGVLIAAIILLLLVVFLAIGLKLENPSRPLF